MVAYPTPSHIAHRCCATSPWLSQSYNTLLTLSHLSDLSDGIVLMSNEALHRLCNKLFNIPKPSFSVSFHSQTSESQPCQISVVSFASV